jgi:ferric-dicitrate binding protein FerR (iron transport regulator)
MKDSKEYIIELIQAYHKAEISDEGIQHLQEWMKEDVANKHEFAKYLAMMKESNSITDLDQIDANVAWTKIQTAIPKQQKASKTRRLHTWLPYAAAITIIFGVSYFLINQVNDKYGFDKDYNFAEISEIGSKKAILTLDGGQQMQLDENQASVISEKDGTIINKDSSNALVYEAKQLATAKVMYNKIEVPRGGEYSLTLADGTKVWLNSESSLRYPVQFTGKTRKVELIGEGCFKVAHNKNQPFVIKAKDTEVKVLGTTFNLSAYDDEEFIETTLVEGSVQVSTMGKSEILEPGYQAVVKRGDDRFEIKKVNTDLYTSWTEGVFRFTDQSLEEICHQLSRWYNVEFFFTEREYRELRFTGAVKKEKSLDFALEMIEKVVDVQFAIKNDRIIVGN